MKPAMELLVAALTLAGLAMVGLGTPTARAAEPTLAGHPSAVPSKVLQQALDRAVERTLAQPWKAPLQPSQVAATVIDLGAPGAPPRTAAFASVRGAEPIYPASVIKLFYQAAVHRWMEDRKIQDTPEVRRALRDMIVESYNEPTHYLIDLLTGTTSGPELPEAELKTWVDQRAAVTRWFHTQGYPTAVNASKKPWCEGPYGRESQAIAAFEPRRNFLTTEATARLMLEIASGRCVNAERSRQMLELMARDFTAPATDPEDQAHGYTGIALKPGTKLWSKCGLTSQTRHDAALIELPSGRRIILVIFTTDHATEREIIPTVARELLSALPPR
jgi:beta-lactamase class A